MQQNRKIIGLSLSLTLSLALLATPALSFPKAGSTAGAPAPASQPQASTSPATASAITKGTVVETMDSGGYTYICIENEGQKRWAAMPTTPVKIGQEVEFGPGTEMGQFKSKTLDRTFDAIYFCSGLVNAPGELPHPIPQIIPMDQTANPSMPPGHGTPGAGMPADHGQQPAVAANGNMPQATTITGKVVETFDAGGYTYASIEQAGKNVWVASPPTKLTVGQDVSFKPGFAMKNFSSKSLNRTFESIIFSAGPASGQ